MKSNLINELKEDIANGTISLRGAIRVLESKTLSRKPHIKLIDRRERYKQRKYDFIARMNLVTLTRCGVTVSTIEDAEKVLNLMRTCTPDEFKLKVLAIGQANLTQLS